MGRLGAAPKKGGGKGGILRTAGKVAGTAIEALSMPQQVVFRTGSALGELATGNVRGTLGELGAAGVELASLGQAKGNLDFAEATTPVADRKAGRIRKLPKGVNVGATMVLDPLNFLTGGTTMEARQGMSAIGKALGGVDKAVVKASAREVGGKALLDNIPRDLVRTSIADDVLRNSRKAVKILNTEGAPAAVKYAEGQADRLLNAVEKRGGGGIGFHVPGTNVQKSLVSGKSIDSAKAAVGGTGAAKALAGTKAAKTAGKALDATKQAIVPGFKMTKEVGKNLSETIRAKGSGRIAKQEAAVDNVLAELDNSVKAAAARKGSDLTPDDDRLLMLALEGGTANAARILLDEAPHLSPLYTALDRLRTIMTDEQVAAKLLSKAATHDTDTYLRRVMTPEMLEVMKADPSLINRVASQVGGSTAGALSQRAAKARKLAPDMPAPLFNELVQRVQAGEDAATLLDDPKFSQYIGVNQKAHAQELLDKQLNYLHNKPITDVTPEQLLQEAADLDAQLNKAIDDAIEAGEEEFTFGSNVYKTPTTPEEHAALKNFLSTLTMHQTVDVNSSNWSNGVAQAISDTAYMLPVDINNSRQIFLGNSPPENRLPHFNKFVEWLDAKSPEAVAYSTELQNRLKALGYPEEMYVFRGYHSGNSSAEFANVSTTYSVAKGFSSADSIPRVYKVKLKDVLGAAHEGEGELIIKVGNLEQVHDDSLKALRLPKKENYTFKKGPVAQLVDGDMFRYNDQSQVLKYKGSPEPGWINVEYVGVNHPVTKKVPVKATQEVDIVTGTKAAEAQSNLSALQKAADEAAQAADDDVIKQLAAGKRILAEQLIKDGAITQDQLAKQVAAALELAKVNSDVTPLKNLIAAQAKRIAEKLPPGAKVYQESALASMITRNNEAARALQAAHYVKELRGLKSADGSRVLIAGDEIGKGKLAPPHGYVRFELPVLGEFHAPPSVAEEIQRVAGYMMKDESVAGFDKFMRNWMQFWKTHATTGLVGSVPFATRNFRSNLYLMAAGGMGPADLGKYLNEARQFQMKVREIVKGKYAEEVAAEGLDKVMKRHLPEQDFKLWKEAQDRGIITQGFFDFDFEQDVMESVKHLGVGVDEGKKSRVGRVAKATLSHKGAVANKGRALNSAIEHNARLAAFMHAIEKTGDWEQAANHVKAVLFDYSDLTPLEQKRLKAIIPFYTFMRKNIPLQFRTLVENPSRVLGPEKVSAAMSEGLDEDAPDYQKEAGYRKSKLPFVGVTAPDRPIYAAAEVFNPLVQLGRGEGKAAARDLANVVGGPQVGLGKALVEIGTGKDAFTGGNVRPGGASAAQRLAGAVMPSLGRLPRVELPGKVSPTRALTGKTPKPSARELTKLLSGLRTEQPK